MPFYTPLRYPGGKRRLESFLMRLVDENGMRDIEYVEPFAGGASVALALLLNEYAATIHLNDLSRPVYAFWHSVLNETRALCQKIEQTDITIDEWHRQRAVYDDGESAALSDLGFAAFFLNRTNRSGIIGGGVIGGKHQNGKWKLDARFNKSDLLQRIRRVGRYRDRIKLYRQDALEFTNDVVSGLGDNVFAFYDPPYIERGKALYLNTYDLDDHRQLAERVVQLRHPWVVTYDYDGAISNGLYSTHQRLAFSLSYSAQDRHRGKEAMFLSEQLSLPETWQSGEPVTMSAARNPYPVYGKMETMKPHPETEEGPRAGERFVSALKTVLSVPKENVPNPFKKPTHKKRKPTTH